MIAAGVQHFGRRRHLSNVIENTDVHLATEAVRTVTEELDRRFAAVRPSLVRVCSSLVGPEEAEDVVQDTYLQARRSVRQLRDPATLEAWLYRIAVNACYGWHRRRRRLSPEAIHLDGRALPARDVGLLQLIELLPARERTILVLHYGHGYGLDEIAGLLGIKHATVRSIIARTRQHLHRDIREAER